MLSVSPAGASSGKSHSVIATQFMRTHGLTAFLCNEAHGMHGNAFTAAKSAQTFSSLSLDANGTKVSGEQIGEIATDRRDVRHQARLLSDDHSIQVVQPVGPVMDQRHDSCQEFHTRDPAITGV